MATSTGDRVINEEFREHFERPSLEREKKLDKAQAQGTELSVDEGKTKSREKKKVNRICEYCTTQTDSQTTHPRNTPTKSSGQTLCPECRKLPTEKISWVRQNCKEFP